MPPYSAKIHWAKRMKERATKEVDQFKSLRLSIAKMDATRFMLEFYDKLMEDLNSYQQKIYNNWISKVESEVGSYLHEFLLKRLEHSNLIEVNYSFDVSWIFYLVNSCIGANSLNSCFSATKHYEGSEIHGASWF